MSAQPKRFSRHTVGRYLVALGAIVAAVAVRVLLMPVTGTGAPFILFFAAVLVTSLSVGTGPGLVALVTSLPIASYLFVVHGGYPVHQAVAQALLYAIDGLIVIYIMHLTTRRRRTLDLANAELQRLSIEAREPRHRHARSSSSRQTRFSCRTSTPVSPMSTARRAGSSATTATSCSG